MPACRPGSRRTLIWHAGSEAHERRPRAFDVLQHPVTGSTYLVLAVGPGPTGTGDEELRLRLEGLGLCGAPDTIGARTIFYALACGGRYAHRDE